MLACSLNQSLFFFYHREIKQNFLISTVLVQAPMENSKLPKAQIIYKNFIWKKHFTKKAAWLLHLVVYALVAPTFLQQIPPGTACVTVVTKTCTFATEPVLGYLVML